VLGDGGYVIAPPRVHASGNRYLFVPSGGLGEVTMAPFPDWLLALLNAPRYWTRR
jgi:hypothetical protein